MLTPHQEEIRQKSLKILEISDRLLIKGSAGVGKTFMVDSLIKGLPHSSVLCSAPTNKAVAVLMGKVTSPKAKFSTTHSALKLKRKINYKTGAITFVPEYSDDDPPLRGVRVLIVDEASMLNTELLSHLEEFAGTKVKIIFIGDEKQLPPVKEAISPVFTKDYPEVELTEIIRQGEANPIIDLSRDLKRTIRFKKDNIISLPDSMPEGYLFSNEGSKVVATLAEANGTDKAKFVAWTNRQVDAVNKQVRDHIYGTPDKIELGESLVFNAPYGEKYFTNEEIIVKELEQGVVKIIHTFAKKGGFGAPDFQEVKLKVYRINPKDVTISNAHPSGILVIHEDSQADYDGIIKDYQVQCKIRSLNWRDFYIFQEQFADMKYNHAITVHKSQGSTFEKTIVDVGNISLNKNFSEQEKMLYTAITRTSKLLILYNA